MQHVLVILASLDIPQALAVSNKIPGCKTWVFDPALVDDAMDGGLPEVELIEWEDCTPFPELHDSSRLLALDIEKELHTSVVRHYLPGLSNFAWLHLNVYYLLMASRWYTSLGLHMAERIAGVHPHIFINDNPSNFFWPSFVPALCLLEAFNARKIEFNAYSYEERADETDVIPMLIGTAAPGSADILTHLPTCLHDAKYFNEEIGATGKPVIDIRAKYWDVNVASGAGIVLTRRDPVMMTLPAAIREQIESCTNHLQDRLNALLSPFLRTESYRARQAAQLASLYKSQLVTSHLLDQYFSLEKPKKLLLSDHDAGFHGPLIAFAEKHRIPVLFVPHSKTIADIQFLRDTVTCLTHPIQGENMADAKAARVLNFKLTYPEQFSGTSAFPERIRKVGLLLNSVSLNGVQVSRYKPYIEGIKRIVGWCRDNDIELEVRGRPGFTMFHLLAEETGIELDVLKAGLNVPLADFARKQDVCLMYDAPTTAAIEFLKNSIPILNPIPEGIAKYEAVLCNTQVVPRGSVDDIMRQMTAFADDPENFHAFRQSQFRDYLELFKGALPLRALLA